MKSGLIGIDEAIGETNLGGNYTYPSYRHFVNIIFVTVAHSIHIKAGIKLFVVYHVQSIHN